MKGLVSDDGLAAQRNSNLVRWPIIGRKTIIKQGHVNK